MNAFRLASRLSSRASSQFLPRGGVSVATNTSTLRAVTPAFQQQLTAAANSNNKYISTSLPKQKEPELYELGSVDHGFTDDRVDRIAEPERRAFTYLLLSGVRFAYASTARVLVVKFVSSMSRPAGKMKM